MSQAPQAIELNELLGQLCDSAITSTGIDRMESLVLGNTEFRKQYIEALHLHAALHWNQAEPAFKESQNHRSRGNINHLTTMKIARWAPLRDRAEGILPFLTRPTLWSTTIVALMFYGAFALIALNLRPSGIWHQDELNTLSSGNHSAEQEESLKENSVHIALLSADRDCQWQGLDDSPVVGQPLPSGKLQLLSGVAELSFAHGAKVMLEGPIDFEPITGDLLRLDVGRLVARVPAVATGFTVQTPYSRVVDRGTEFEVVATESGETEVKVLSGRVDLLSLNDDVKPLATLTTGDVGHVMKSTKSNTPIVKTSRALTNDNAFSATKPSMPGLVMWLRADAIKTKDPTQVRISRGSAYDNFHVVRWLNQVKGGDKLIDVTQPSHGHQPRWVAKAINGRPAVRFDRDRLDRFVNDRVNLVPPGAPRTIFVVGRANVRSDRAVGGTLLTFGIDANDAGPVFTMQQFFTGPYYPPNHNKYCLYSDGVHLLQQPEAENTAETEDVSAVIVSHFLAVCRSAGTGHPLHFELNTHEQRYRSGAKAAMEAVGKGFVLGARGIDAHDAKQAWDGDIAEVLVYDRELSSEDLQLVSKYLIRKYRLSFDGQETKQGAHIK